MITKQDGFTLIELMIVISILAILAGLSLPKMNSYFEYLELMTISNNLVSDLQWARQQSIIKNIKHGLIFYQEQNKYQIVKDKELNLVLKEVNLNNSKVELNTITFAEHNGGRAVFFKVLGNLDNANGSVELFKAGFGIKRVVFSSNAGELNVE